ncbi:Retrotransposon gag domain [Sesbania bispinosa]|nr:Retrotransposon gag domain [Sesbania bispinosa]
MEGEGATVFSPSVRRRRSEIPLFSGEEDSYVNVWLNMAEKYFLSNAITDDHDKLQAATVALGGRALNWFNLWGAHIQGKGTTWSSFKTALLRRFQPQNPHEKLLRIRQTGAVDEYRELFKILSKPLNIDEEILKAIFTNGLKEEMRAEMGFHNVETLSELMGRAQLIEDRIEMASNRLIKLWGEINGSKVTVLVASGASHSMIAKRVVKELGLPVTKTREHFAELGNGTCVNCNGVCNGVVMKVQEMEIMHDFFLFELGEEEDVVLGMDWLMGLGEIVADFREMSMEFQVGGKAITLKADPSLSSSKTAIGKLSYVNFQENTMVLQDDGRSTWEELNFDLVLRGFEGLFKKP